MATKEPTSRPVVTVGCKLPNGLILRIFEMKARNELVLGGGMREVQMAQTLPVAPITIKGCAVDPQKPIALFGGYALTEGVDAEVWDEWLKQNADSDIVINRLVFAHEDSRESMAEAKDNRKTESGLEPLDTEGDKRAPKRVMKANLKEDA